MSESLITSDTAKHVERLLHDENTGLVSTTEIGKFSETKLTPSLSRRSIVSTYCSSTTTSYRFTKVSKSSQHAVNVKRLLNGEEDKSINPSKEEIQWYQSGNSKRGNIGGERKFYIEEIPVVEEIPVETKESQMIINPDENILEVRKKREPENDTGDIAENEVGNYKNLLPPENNLKNEIITEEHDENTKVLGPDDGESTSSLDMIIKDETSLAAENQIYTDILEENIKDSLDNIEHHKNVEKGNETFIENKIKASGANVEKYQLEPEEGNYKQAIEDIPNILSINHMEKDMFQMISTERGTSSISRQSSSDEGRQNALLFVIFITFLAMLIQALYGFYISK